MVKLVIKMLFLGTTKEEAMTFHIHCSGHGETEFQSVLLGDRASHQYDFSGFQF